jgi:hypothetical protein
MRIQNARQNRDRQQRRTAHHAHAELTLAVCRDLCVVDGCSTHLYRAI